jgi:hypothetical protein
MRRLDEEIRRRIDTHTASSIRIVRREARPPLGVGDAIVFHKEDDEQAWCNGRILALDADGDRAEIHYDVGDASLRLHLGAVHATHAALPVSDCEATTVVEGKCVTTPPIRSQVEEHDGYACEISEDDTEDWMTSLIQMDLLFASSSSPLEVAAPPQEVGACSSSRNSTPSHSRKPPPSHSSRPPRRKRRRRRVESLQACLQREGLDAQATVAFEFEPALVRFRRDQMLKQLPQGVDDADEKEEEAPPSSPKDDDAACWWTEVSPQLWTTKAPPLS